MSMLLLTDVALCLPRSRATLQPPQAVLPHCSSTYIECFQSPQPESFCISAQIHARLTKSTGKHTFTYIGVHRQVNQEKQLHHSYLIGQMDT